MKVPSNIRTALAIAAVGGGITLFAWAAVQQNYRQSANDPQIQLAEDAAAELGHGAAPAALVPSTNVDMRTSLAPFLIVTDANRNVLASSGRLDGRTVLPPAGAFDMAKDSTGKDTTQPHQNRITWQPAPGVREAAVIVHYNGGYVVAARSLREVEIRAGRLQLLALVTLAGISLAMIAIRILLY